jgi:hypothetical protein
MRLWIDRAQYEVIWLRVMVRKNPCLLGVFYVPELTAAQANDFIVYLEDSLDFISQSSTLPLFLLGV